MKSAKTKRQKRSYQMAEFAGKIAEFLIYLRYLIYGFHLIHWRHRTIFGEIDLVMRKGAHIRFIEVKYRKRQAMADSPVSSVQMARLQRATRLTYHQLCPDARASCQFDVILVRWPYHCHLYENHIDMSQTIMRR